MPTGLTMGQWTHLTGDQRVIVPESLDWLDHYLAGDAPEPRRLPVRVWESGLNTWRGLTENVNIMASNLTDQVRNVNQVATAMARGDL